MEMVAYLVAKETLGCRPPQHLLVGGTRGNVAMNGYLIAVKYRGGGDCFRGEEQSFCSNHLKKNNPNIIRGSS